MPDSQLMWFDLMPSGAIVQDDQGALIKVNPAAIALLGQPQGGWDASNPFDWQGVHEDNTPCPASEFPSARALRTGQPVLNAILGVTAPNGRFCWLRVNSHPIDDQGRRHVLTLFDDVTEWKRTRDAVRLDRQLFEHGPVVVLQRQGSPNRLVRLSKNFEAVFGLDPAPFLSGEKDLWDLIHPDDQTALAEQRQLIQQGAGFSELTGTFRLLAGEWRTIDYRTVLDSGGPSREPSTVAYWIDRTSETKSHRRLTMTLEAASTGTWEWDIQTDRLSVDDEWRRLLGFANAEEFAFEDWSALVHPSDREEWNKNRKELKAGDAVAFDLKVRLRHPSGWLWTRVRGKVFDALEGGLSRVLGTAEDISEVVRAEDELLVLSQVVEQGPSAVLITDLSGAIEYVNRQFSVVTGYSLNEVQGQNARVLKGTETGPETFVELWSALRAGRPWMGELQNIKKDGSPYWVQASISPITDSTGQVHRYVGQQIDITARKTVEQANRAQYRFQHLLTQASARLVNLKGEQALPALTETLGDLGQHFQADRVFIAFLAGDGLVLNVAYGWSRAGAPLPGAIALADAPLWRKRIQGREPILSVGLPSLVPWSPRPLAALLTAPLDGGAGEAGTLVLESVNVRPWTPDEQISVTVVANTLSSFLKRLSDDETVKRARQEAETANQAKSDFLAHMSHEIRTPMNGILGLAELALGKSMDADARPLVEGIRASGETLLSLVNDILDVSKIEAGKLELEQIDFSLREVLSVTAPLGVLAAKKNLELSVTWGEPLVDFRRGDPTRLKQILTNLVGNAIKFTTRGSVSVHIEPGEGDVEVKFSVRDTGPGVAPDRQARLFQRYSQTEASTTRKFGGTGLGLAICRELVDRMGGGIGYLDARPGGLFWFTIPLPLASGPVAPAAPVAQTIEQISLRVLVVEDNLVNQQVASGLLRRHGVDPKLASDGFEALEALKSGEFDLVLMDVQMPVMDGLAATRAIRRGEGGERHAAVPIVAMTANAMEGDREASLKAGMDDYVTKPISAAKIASLLEKWSRTAAGKVEYDRRIFNPEEMRLRLQLEDDFVRQIVKMFFDDLPVRRRALVDALAGGLLEETERLAHNLKGTASNLVAQGVAEAADQLEQAARQGDAASAARLQRTVLTEIDHLRTALAEFLR